MKQFLASCLFLVAFAATAVADDAPKHPEMWMFDSKPITATAPAKGKASFKIASDHLYARVFYDRPIKEVFSLTPEKYNLHVYEAVVGSGTAYDHIDLWIAKKDFDNKWIDLEIFPDPATAKTKFGEHDRPFHYAFAYAKGLTGPQQVYFSIGAQADKDERAAVVAVDFTGLDADKLVADAKATAESGKKAFASNFGLPKPGSLHSAALAKQTEAMTKKLGSKDIAQVKVIFTADAWELERNDLTGRILSRVADASVVIKDKQGVCTLDTGLVRQSYVGGKFRAPGEWANTASTPQQIDCAKAFR
ncbi:MAG TPA: hypothetical protein VFQ53_04810 [Kofleriaceae bacterium]|nr:hypothetical protein [Kofleriaceae bacterium]